jgi:hypothetical protein
MCVVRARFAVVLASVPLVLVLLEKGARIFFNKRSVSKVIFRY